MGEVGTDVNGWLFLIRAVHFAATALLAGVLVFREAVAAPALRDAPAAADVFDSQSRRLAWAGLLICVASGAAWLLLQLPAMSGLSFAEAITSEVAGTVLTQTQFGLALDVRLLLAAVLVVCLVFLDKHPAGRWLALVSALVLLAALAWTSHAGSAAGERGAVGLVADAVHLVAAASWTGGLASLAVLLALAARHRIDMPGLSLQRAVKRFSTLGILSVIALLITGIVNAAALVGSIHALASTLYGRLLVLKVALFAMMLGLAVVNKMRLTPKLALHEQGPIVGLARNCTIELALALAIYVVVGVLGAIHPAIHSADGTMTAPAGSGEIAEMGRSPLQPLPNPRVPFTCNPGIRI